MEKIKELTVEEILEEQLKKEKKRSKRILQSLDSSN